VHPGELGKALSGKAARVIACAAMAKITGTGIDAIEIGRIKEAIEHPRTGERFRARVFTPAEVAYCESRQRVKYQSYAARFAAKEATMKALGTGWNRNVGWNEIEVRRERGRAPQITLLGKAARFARNLGVKRLHLSLTHSSKDAIAHVIAET
jgi:holo-[acyl-carrier protein] synthase